jgi:pimeloyl-ACP methyl ester carboxylesterase
MAYIPPADLVAECDPDGLQSSGAVYRICMPPLDRWNGELVVYAHGYVAPDRPIEIPEEQLGLPDGPSIPEVANLLGFAFATTSYNTNGLAVKTGVHDLVDLVGIFAATYGSPDDVILVGLSEGGLIATLALERFPDVFDGALAGCGPIGDFQQQADYFADFRVVFDYLFPVTLPGSAFDIPQELVDDWDAYYAPLVLDAVEADPETANRLLDITFAPRDWRDPGSVGATTIDLLWYNVHATNDAIDKLTGQPVDNTDRSYKGLPEHDAALPGVERVSADANARSEINAFYQTTGLLTRPLVTIHTTRDPVVPSWHQRIYTEKTLATGSFGLLTHFTVRRYGHCNFTAGEILEAFAAVVQQVRGETPNLVDQPFSESDLHPEDRPTKRHRIAG